MKKYITELFFTTEHVTEDEWLKFILEISRLNGLFKTWKIHIKIERNIIKYYIETTRKIPTIANCSGDFLIKNIDNFEKIKTYRNSLYWLTNKEKNIVDIFDKNETKHNRKLTQIEIKIIPFKRNNYLTKTLLTFEKSNNRYTQKIALFSIPHSLISIDFTKHTRFLYRKEGTRYLKLDKSIGLFAKQKSKDNLLEINAFPYSQEKYYLNLPNYDFGKHSLIVGASGTGKSKLIATLIKNIYDNEILRKTNKIILIDPHASIEDDIGGLEESCVIDMKKEESSCDLWINSKENATSGTEIILTILKNIFGEQFNSKLERVLRHSIYFLMKKEILNFNNLRKLLTQTEYKNELIRNSPEIEENIKEFFLTDFNQLKTNSYQEAISPIIGLIDEMQMLPAFQNKSTTPIKDLLQKNFLSIFSLNQAELGEKVTKTIAGLIIGIIFQLVQKRNFNEHITLIIDEVAVIENPILRNLLSEARKYNLSIILAQQYFSQVSKELKDAIFSNVMNYYSFRISREDAVFLANQLQMEMAVKNTYHNRIKLLTELPNRECIVRITNEGKLIPAFRCKTLDFAPLPRKKNQILEKTQNKNNIEIDDIKIEKSHFELGKAFDLQKLMQSQSTSRRKMKYE